MKMLSVREQLPTPKPVQPMTPMRLPTFDLHAVEAALRMNHVLYEGKPLTEQQITTAVQEYRLFLAQHRATGMPKQFAVPSYVVDRVWHTHMCETEQYAADCQSYFGAMFHHSAQTCNNPTGFPSGGGGELN